jgi:hypothetical protein
MWSGDADGATVIGLSVNSTQLSSDIKDINPINRLGFDYIGALGTGACISTSVNLKVGDVIRPHGAIANSTTVRQGRHSFSISKAGSLKQLNISNDSKIVIPTHQLRFEGASSRGGTDTAIVKFDTQAITQGDAWDVVNTAANGTVVTMKKAGKLQVSAGIATANTGIDVRISKNQTTLTSVPPIAEIIASGSQITTSEQVCITGFTDVNIGDKIRVSTEPQNANGTTNFFTLSLTENSIPANFSNVLPQWSQSDSAVRLNTLGNGSAGYGSTNTAIYRFVNTVDNFGSAITYTDSATLGASFTANEEGLYNISWSGDADSAFRFGLSKNSTQLTTAIQDISAVDRLSVDYISGLGQGAAASTQVYLVKGDVIRPHGDSAVSVTARNARHVFQISKVGKPNLTSVDVTPFVNMKTTDVEAIEAPVQTSSWGSTNTGVAIINVSKNTNLGVIQTSSDAVNGTTFRVLKDCRISMSVVGVYGTGGELQITKNSTNLVAAGGGTGVIAGVVGQQESTAGDATLVFDGLVVAGDVIRIQRNSIAGVLSTRSFSLTATADNNATASPTQQVSSDTMSFVFKATAIDPNTDAVGTFNTYTYAASGNVATIAGTAPTQTTASMNTDGVRIFGRAFNATSTAASPSRVDVFIGKGLKSKQVDAYASTAKTTPFFYDRIVSGVNEFGVASYYNETTGILTIQAGTNISGATTGRYVDSIALDITNGYFVFNASKSPILTTIPNLAPRIATISDVKASGTGGGTPVTTTFTASDLNTLNDPTGIVVSLSSNTFTLSKGTYLIESNRPFFRTNAAKTRLRNTTDSITSSVGTSGYSDAAGAYGQNHSFVDAIVTITSQKSFQLQYYASSAAGGTIGLGVANSTGESEVYTQVRITKIKD